MAPTFRHGKGARLAVNAKRFDRVLNDMAWKASVDTADVTVYNSTTGGVGAEKSKEYLAGHRDASFTMSGLFDGSTERVAEILNALMGSTTPVQVTWMPDASSVGATAVKLIRGRVTAVDVASPAQGAVSAAFTVQASSKEGLTGFVLRNSTGTIATSTTNGTAVVLGSTTVGPTTRGGTAHLHVHSKTGGGNLTCRIQHSSGGAWADHTSFAVVTAATWQRIALAGSIKEQVRVQHWGSSTGVFDCTVALARY